MVTPFEARCVFGNDELEAFVKLYAKAMQLDINEHDGYVTLHSNRLTVFQNTYFKSCTYSGLFSNIISFDNEHGHAWKNCDELHIWFDLHKHEVE